MRGIMRKESFYDDEVGSWLHLFTGYCAVFESDILTGWELKK
jgi:hypothetical protein